MKNILAIFDKQEKIRVFVIFLGILIHGIIELTSVASIIPFMSLVMDTSIIERNSLLNGVYVYFGYENYRDFLIFSGLIVFFLLASSNAFSAFIFWWITRFVHFQSFRLSQNMLSNYLYQPYHFFLDRNTSDLSKNVLSEVNRIIIGVVYPFLLAASKIIIIIFLLALIIYANPSLSISIALVLSFSYGMIYLFVRNNLREIGEKSTESVLNKFKHANEAFSGIKDIKLKGSEKQFIDKYSAPAKDFALYTSKSAIVSLLPRYALETFAFGGILLIVVYLLATNNNYLDVIPIVSLYALAGYRLMPSLQQVYHSFVQIRYNKPAMEILIRDMNSFKKYQSSINNLDQKSLKPFEKELRLIKISYRYPGTNENVLNNINVSFKCKSLNAVVGSTGSGKTTLIDLMLGLLKPLNGYILIDNQKIDSSNLTSWQKKLGYVPQNIYLIDDTIKNNIAFAIPEKDIDYDRVLKAAKLAELDEYVDSLPDKFNTYVGERGVRISGGQAQRIGIARALYNDPDILVFDEATSSLDNITEKNIMNSITKLKSKKTIIIIAHRLSTIKNCDQIHFLEKGEIASSGTYSELINKNLNFMKMVEITNNVSID